MSDQLHSPGVQRYVERGEAMTAAAEAQRAIMRGKKFDTIAVHGLYNAHQGLLYMLGLTAQQPTPVERIRSNARVITIWMSDEAAQGMNSQVKGFYKNNPNLYGYAITAHNTNSNCTTGFSSVMYSMTLFMVEMSFIAFRGSGLTPISAVLSTVSRSSP